VRFLSVVCPSDVVVLIPDFPGDDISSASTSSYVQRISAEQAALEARLVELEGMETIQTGMKNTKIRGEEDMVIDESPEPPMSRTIEAKRKALSRFVRNCFFLQPYIPIDSHSGLSQWSEQSRDTYTPRSH
jgi:hypothetical protein